MKLLGTSHNYLIVLVALLLCASGVLSAQTVTKDASVYLRVLNGVDGSVLDTVDARFSVGSTDQTLADANIRDTEVLVAESGVASTALVGGIEYRAQMTAYQNGVAVETGIDLGNGTYLLPPHRTFLITPKSLGRKFVDFLMQPTDTVLQVNAADANGEALKSGYIEAFAEADSERRLSSHLVRQRLSGSIVTLPILPGRNYSVSIATALSGQVVPEPQKVILTSGESRLLGLQMIPVSHTLVLSTKTAVTVDSRSSLTCYASDKSGRFVVASSTDLTTVNLSLVQGEWQVGCQLLAVRESQSRLYKGDTSYSVSEVSTQGSVELTLDKEEIFYPEETVEFDAEQDKVIVAQDGQTSVEVPAQAIAEQGVVQLLVQTGAGYTAQETFEPVLAFDIKMLVNGQQISSTRKPVLLSLPVADSELTRLGALAEDAYPASFDPETNQWQRETNYTYDPVTKSMKVYVTHFSIWGVLIDLSKKIARGIPDKLRARARRKSIAKSGKKKVRKAKTVRLRWNPPESAEGKTEYLLQIAKRTRQRTGKEARGQRFIYSVDWEKARSFTVRRRSQTVRLSRGTYQFRVSAAGGEFSAPKQFRVR